ncbi:Beta-mannosidase [Dirofilaria immitis]|nr:Beta-mannosidase [Dirofilaria immitis]
MIGFDESIYNAKKLRSKGEVEGFKEILRLDEFQWYFRSTNDSIRGLARVPGDIYQDLFLSNYISEPLFRENDRLLRWIPRTDWIYYTTFTIPRNWSTIKAVLLNAHGLDTVADIFFNDALRQFGHVIPPVCPVSEFRGECHKDTSKLRVGLGPSFPTVGIWKPISVEGVQGIFLVKMSTLVSFKKQHFIVSVRITVWSAIKVKYARVILALPEISITNQFITSFQPMNRNIVKGRVLVPDNTVERWWPNGSGKQKLYKLVATVSYEGANWIPLSAFPARDHSFKEKFLLESARESNMNVLRVWGGGHYESDHFYDLADELGLMIWQDMMFACALYPVDKQYLNSVREEVHAQVERLRHHPSIFVWAGNNENELGIRQWFFAENYSFLIRYILLSSRLVADYMKLYNETIRPIIAKLDGTRPYLLSSPTNGVESEKEGGVATYPADEKYGDIHFYNELDNLWKDSTYQIPRCSSEYGVQSFPRKETMLKWLNEADWSYTSEEMRRRQHHPGGFVAQLFMIFSHFKIPSDCEKTVNDDCDYLRTEGFMDRFVYLSQFHQAVTYQIQTEHYRRQALRDTYSWRGRLMKDGRGDTMCALYWQLNDVWAAPTWSTIDYELSWKPAHYFARRFFAPAIDEELHLFIISDLIKPMYNVTVILETFREKRNDRYVLRGRMLSNDSTQIGYDIVHLPDKLFKVNEVDFGKAWIQKLRKENNMLYELKLEADKIAPFVYLELAPDLIGWFSDNAFTMTEPKRA